MFGKTAIISGILLVASAVTTPASASNINISVDLGLDRLLLSNDGNGIQYGEPERVQRVRYDSRRYKYRDSDRRRDRQWDRHDSGSWQRQIRRINRQLRRRGLYSINEPRLKRGRIIIFAENTRGARYRVTASRRNGDILDIVPVRNARIRRPARNYDWQPSYDSWSSYDWRPSYELRSKRPGRKANRRIKKRYKDNADFRPKKRRNRNADVRPKKRPAKVAKRVRRETQRKLKRPYIDRTPEQYELWQYGSGK